MIYNDLRWLDDVIQNDRRDLGESRGTSNYNFVNSVALYDLNEYTRYTVYING